jgi:hypothetical protein
VRRADTRRPGFAEECRYQSPLAAATDAEISAFLDVAPIDLLDDGTK